MAQAKQQGGPDSEQRGLRGLVLRFGGDKLRFLVNRLSERLWIKPVVVCMLSIIGALLARTADGIDLDGFQDWVPEVSRDSITDLLKIISQSMMAIATFAVASLVSAYASASRTATPRAFSLILADDRSQNALSTFIGAFIFSIVALIALENGYYGRSGRFALFALTLLTFATVIVTFLRWVDSIARLGRMGVTIDMVEAATAAAMRRRRAAPRLGGAAPDANTRFNASLEADTVGYVQRIDMALLERVACDGHLRLRLSALPGTFAAPGRPLLQLYVPSGQLSSEQQAMLRKAFVIDGDRRYDDDPRFGLVVLGEIAGRALSPAVNDPGTAIDIIGTLVRLFVTWADAACDMPPVDVKYAHVQVEELDVGDMFDDAFTTIARDGAGMVEVCVRLQKALESLTHTDDPALQAAARRHAHLARERAERALCLPQDLDCLHAASHHIAPGGTLPR